MLTKECEEYPDISPPVVVTDVQWNEKLLSNLELAVFASNGTIDVVNITTKNVHERLCPLATCLARRRIECRKFIWLAFDHKAANETSTIGNHTGLTTILTGAQLKL